MTQVKGSVTRIVLAAATDLWSIPSNGLNATHFGSFPKDSTIELSALADGSKIGTLISKASGGETVTILDQHGVEIHRITMPATKNPLPGVSSVSESGAIVAWNPAGDRLLYGKRGGGIDALSLSGQPSVFVSPRQTPLPGTMVWSPKGDAIAFVSRKSLELSDGLFVGSTSSLPVDAAVLVEPSSPSKRSIPQIAWLADGKRILFTQRTLKPNEALSGDLFEVSAAGGGSKLFVSAGLAAPVSAIGVFSVSPGDEAIAFTALVPKGKSIAFHSLWIKPMGSGASVRIDVTPNATVTGLWWTVTGLVWREQLGTLDPNHMDGPFQLRRLAPAGTGELIFSSQASTPATPIASPVVASPVASPITNQPTS